MVRYAEREGVLVNFVREEMKGLSRVGIRHTIIHLVFTTSLIRSTHRAMTKSTANSRGCLVDLLKSLRHHLDAITRIPQVGHRIRVLVIMQRFNRFLEPLFMLMINLHQGRLLWLSDWYSGRLNSLDCFLIRGTGICNGILLTLLGSGSSSGLFTRWWGTSCTPGCTWIIVNTLHVVIKVPAAWETIACDAALAAFILAEEWFIPVSMHSVSFSLMAE